MYVPHMANWNEGARNGCASLHALGVRVQGVDSRHPVACLYLNILS